MIKLPSLDSLDWFCWENFNRKPMVFTMKYRAVLFPLSVLGRNGSLNDFDQT